jgi:hypothetical protein
VEPPAEMAQNSNKPSKGGQSSPIRSGPHEPHTFKQHERTSGLFPGQDLQALGSDACEEVDVFVRVKGRHAVCRSGLGPDDVHLAVQAVVQNQVVGNLDPVASVSSAPDPGRDTDLCGFMGWCSE